MGSWFIMTYHRWMCSGYMVDKRPTIGLAKNNARRCCKLSWNCPYYWLFTCPPLEVWPFIYSNQVFLWIFSFSICQETTFGGHFLFQALEIDRSTNSKELSSTDLNQKPPTNLNCIPSTSTTSISFNFFHNQFVSHRNSSNKHQHHSHHCHPPPPSKKKPNKPNNASHPTHHLPNRLRGNILCHGTFLLEASIFKLTFELLGPAEGTTDFLEPNLISNLEHSLLWACEKMMGFLVL